MKVSFHTLGCKTNAYETQAVREQFQAAGYEIREFSDPCDVYVINTCAVTGEAARKSRQMTGRCKRKNPDALVVVTGCYAQEAGAELLTETMADLVVGNGEKTRIVSLVDQMIAAGRLSERPELLPETAGISDKRTEQVPAQTGSPAEHIYIKALERCREYERQNITAGQEGHVRAYVKIQDGCDRFCSYCLIPYLRGRSRSRSIEDILQEATALTGAGYKEIVLTGIDISSFRDESCRKDVTVQAADGGSTGTGSQTDLAELIEQLGAVEGIERIRLGSLEAGIVSDDLIRRLSSVPAFCPHFHLSLQSGSDTVLKRMNRHYTAEEYADAVGIIRTYFPEAGITTDIITGFPGETEEEFEETVRFAERIGFSRLHVFPYSRRKGTRADRLPEQLPRAVKEERAGRLIRTGEALREAYESRLIGRCCRILAEECIPVDGQMYLAGYTPEYVRILIPAGDKAKQPGRMAEAVPKGFRNGILIAENSDF